MVLSNDPCLAMAIQSSHDDLAIHSGKPGASSGELTIAFEANDTLGTR